MSREELHALEIELRAPAPDGLAQCAPQDLRHLTAAISDARRRQAAELEAAGDQALRHIPKLLRVAIRKAFG